MVVLTLIALWAAPHTHHPCVGADIRITVSLSERERGERDREAATDTRRG